MWVEKALAEMLVMLVEQLFRMQAETVSGRVVKEPRCVLGGRHAITFWHLDFAFSNKPGAIFTERPTLAFLYDMMVSARWLLRSMSRDGDGLPSLTRRDNATSLQDLHAGRPQQLKRTPVARRSS